MMGGPLSAHLTFHFKLTSFSFCIPLMTDLILILISYRVIVLKISSKSEQEQCHFYKKRRRCKFDAKIRKVPLSAHSFTLHAIQDFLHESGILKACK